MRLTNGQFVEQLLSVWVSSNELVHYLEVSMKLLKKYGRSILTKKYLIEVKKTSPEVVSVLSALKVADKSNIAKIKTIIRLIKEWAKDYIAEFVIKTGNENNYDTIKKFLDMKFADNSVEKKVDSDNLVKISGEWWFYKRWLEQDVKKILWVSN